MVGEYLAIAFDVRIYCIEYSILKSGSIKDALSHVKTVRLIAQYLLQEKASVPQVRDKTRELIEFINDAYWEAPTVQRLEKSRIWLRDLMQFTKSLGPGKHDIDIPDIISEADYVPDETNIDIRTYREKVLDYLIDNSDNPVIKKIYNIEPINEEDLKELEKVLWHDLGSQEDYTQTTSINNLAVFIRSLIGLSQEAVNEKFGEYLSGNKFNSQQQEFILTIINYVRENGDVELSDMVNTEPFNNYDLNDMFGVNLSTVVGIVKTLHESIVTEAA